MKWKYEETEELLKLYVFLTNGELAVHLNRSYSAITAKLNKLGCRRKNPDEAFRTILPPNIVYTKNSFTNTKTGKTLKISKTVFLQYSSLELKLLLDVDEKI